MNNRTQDRRISTRHNAQYNVGYASNTVRIDKNSHVISGYFPKQNSVKAVAIKKVNNTVVIIGSGITKLSRKSKLTMFTDLYGANINLIKIAKSFK